MLPATDDAAPETPPTAETRPAATIPARSRGRFALLLPFLLGALALTAIVFALLPSLGGARTLLPALRQIRPAFLALGVVGQAAMYVGVAGILRAGLSGGTERTEAMPSAADPKFVGAAAAFLWANRVFPGPAVAGLATLIFVMGRRGFSPQAAQAAAATFYLVDYISFAAVTIVLFAALGLLGRLAGLNTVFLGIAMAFVLLAMFATIVLLRSPRLVGNLAESAAGKTARLLKRRDADTLATGARSFVDGFYARWKKVSEHPTALVSACAWGILIHAAEIATVLCGLLAFQSAAPPFRVLGLLFAASGAAYVAANLAAIVSFLPAGIGAFEAVMAATLHVVGKVPVPEALLATLLYRLLSVWLPLPFILQTARQALQSAARTLRIDRAASGTL